MKAYGRHLVTFAIPLLLVGCSKPTPEDFIQTSNEYLNNGNLETALVNLKTAVQAYPEDTELRSLLASAMYESGNLQGAEKELKRLVEANPTSSELLERYFFALYHQNKYEDIILHQVKAEINTPIIKQLKQLSDDGFEVADRETDTRPNLIQTNTQAPAVRIAHLFTDGEYTEVLSLIESESFDPKFKYYVSTYKAKAYFQTAQYDLALAELNGTLGQWKSIPELNYLVGMSHYKKGEFEKAKNVASEALKQNNQVWSRYVLALSHAELENFTEALRFAEESASNGIDDAYYLAGVIASKLEEWERAYTNLEKANKLYPDHIGIKRAYSFVLLKLGYIDDAIAVIEKTDASMPEGAELLSDTVSYLYSRGDKQKALALLNKKGSAVSSSLLTRQQALLQLEQGKDISSLVNKLLSENDTSFGTNWLKIQNYIAQGEFVEAKKLANQYSEVNQQHSFLFTSVVSLYEKDFEASLANAKEVLERDNTNLTAHKLSMLSANELGNYSIAIDNALALLKLNPDDKQTATDLVFLYTKEYPNDFEQKLLDDIETHALPSSVVDSLASYFLGNGKPGEAEKLLLAFSEQISYESHVNLLNILLSQSRYTKAEEIAKKRIETSEQKTMPILSLIAVFEAQEKHSDVSMLLNTYQQELGDSKEAALVKYTNSFATGDFEEAKQAIFSLEKFGVSESLISVFKGEVDFKQGNVNEALNHFKSSYAKSPDFGTAVYIAKTLVRLQRVEEGADVLVKELARSHSPNKRQYNIVAEYLNKFNFHEQAIRVYENLERRFTLTPEEYNNISDVNLKLNRLDLAEDYIKMALAEKRLPLFLMTYSEVQLKKGNNDLAEQALLETLKSDESNEHANVLLASVYVKQGRKEDAIKIINQFDSVQSAHSQKWASLRSQLD
ncbi:tetratricopeptide repeat protein [Alteromonadaceae bacterium A_SAG1]|nr:tetratricopeptide repeat protein [Alteromonadaceae bacterium A_SAG1]